MVVGYSDGTAVVWLTFRRKIFQSVYSGTCQTSMPHSGRSPNLLVGFALRLCEISALRRMNWADKEQVREVDSGNDAICNITSLPPGCCSTHILYLV